MSTFGDMVGRIDDETQCNGEEDANIKLCINDAIAFYRNERFWFTEEPTGSALTSATTANNSYVARYTGLIQLDSLRITISGLPMPMTQVSFDTMESYHDGTTSTGRPWAYCLYGDRMRIYPTPNDVYTLTWSGIFQDTTTLVADGDTNDWTTYGEQLIRHRAKGALMRDVLRDRDDEVATEAVAEREALVMLTRESLRRSSRRKLKAGM